MHVVVVRQVFEGCLCCQLCTMFVVMCVLSALKRHHASFHSFHLCPQSLINAAQAVTPSAFRRILLPSLPFLLLPLLPLLVIALHNTTHTPDVCSSECERQTGRVFACERRVIASNDRVSSCSKLQLVISCQFSSTRYNYVHLPVSVELCWFRLKKDTWGKVERWDLLLIHVVVFLQNIRLFIHQHILHSLGPSHKLSARGSGYSLKISVLEK